MFYIKARKTPRFFFARAPWILGHGL